MFKPMGYAQKFCLAGPMYIANICLRICIKTVLVRLSIDPVIAWFIQASMSKIQGLLKASPTVFKDIK